MTKKTAAPESNTIKQHSNAITNLYRVEVSTTEVVTVEIEADSEADAMDAVRCDSPQLERFDSHYLEPRYRVIHLHPLGRCLRASSDDQTQ